MSYKRMQTEEARLTQESADLIAEAQQIDQKEDKLYVVELFWIQL